MTTLKDAVVKTIAYLEKDHVQFGKGQFKEYLDNNENTRIGQYVENADRPCKVCLLGALYSVLPYGTDETYDLAYGKDGLETCFRNLFKADITEYNDDKCNSKEDQINALNVVLATL
jgi:hypothetical protein